MLDILSHVKHACHREEPGPGASREPRTLARPARQRVGREQTDHQLDRGRALHALACPGPQARTLFRHVRRGGLFMSQQPRATRVAIYQTAVGVGLLGYGAVTQNWWNAVIGLLLL